MSVRIRGLVHHFLPVPGDLTPLMLPCFKAARPCKAGRGVLPKAFVSHAQLIQPPIRPARIHTFALASRPTCASATSPSASTRIDRAHFAASTRLILPLYLGAACPIKLAWKISPYLGVCTREKICQYLSNTPPAHNATKCCLQLQYSKELLRHLEEAICCLTAGLPSEVHSAEGKHKERARGAPHALS